MRSFRLVSSDRFCPACGTPLPADARFCPSCGSMVPAVPPAAILSEAAHRESQRNDAETQRKVEPQPPGLTPAAAAPIAAAPPAPPRTPVAPPPASISAKPSAQAATPAAVPSRPVPPPQTNRRRSGFSVGVGIVIVVLLVGAGLALLAAMPFGSDDSEPEVTTATVGEGKASQGFTRIRELETEPDEPAAERSEPTREERRVEETDAIALVRRYVTTNRSYGVEGSCIAVESEGFKNQGYTLRVLDRCENTTLGRWRVDALTEKLYRQRDDGRYLSP